MNTGGYCVGGGTNAYPWGILSFGYSGGGSMTITDKGSWYDPTRQNNLNFYVNATYTLPNPTAFGINAGAIQEDLFYRIWVRPDGTYYIYGGN